MNYRQQSLTCGSQLDYGIQRSRPADVAAIETSDWGDEAAEGRDDVSGAAVGAGARCADPSATPQVRIATRPQLSSSAYQRVFDVLESCEGAESVVDLAERLVYELPRVYRCCIATFFTGETLSSAVEDPTPKIVAASDVQSMWSEYQRKWRSSDVYASRAAQSELIGKGAAVLRYLDGIPAESASYVTEFLVARGIAGSAAMRLVLAGGDTGLVGMFATDAGCFTREDVHGLALLAGRLSAIARLLPREVPNDALAGISGSCRKVALLVGQGMTNSAIGLQLCLAEDTVKKYVSRVLAATGCRTRTELAIRVQQQS